MKQYKFNPFQLIGLILLIVVIVVTIWMLVPVWRHRTRYSELLEISKITIPDNIDARTIIEPTQLDQSTWKDSGAMLSDPSVTICPILYGSFHNGKVYEWKDGKHGNRVGTIERIDGTSQTTTITWRSGTENKNIVTVEGVSGCGMYDDVTGWETGTIYGRGAPTSPNPAKFAHVFKISNNGKRRVMWEAITPDNMTVLECLEELEDALRNNRSSKLDIYFMTADKVESGGIPDPAKITKSNNKLNYAYKK